MMLEEGVREDVRSLESQMHFSGWRESRRNSPRQVGSCKCMCCVLRMPGSFYEEEGESGKVGGAIVRYVSNVHIRVYAQVPTSSSFCLPEPELRPINSAQEASKPLFWRLGWHPEHSKPHWGHYCTLGARQRGWAGAPRGQSS